MMVKTFISSDNPNYKQLPMRMNSARSYQLLHDLQEAGARVIHPAKFVDKTSGYSENSFYAELPLSEAIRLGKVYGQESILVEGIGVLNLHTMKANPITAKHTGQAARSRSAMSVVFEQEPRFVAYDIDFEHSKRLRK